MKTLNCMPRVIEAPDHPQIESGDFHIDGVLIGSEGQPAAMYASD